MGFPLKSSPVLPNLQASLEFYMGGSHFKRVQKGPKTTINSVSLPNSAALPSLVPEWQYQGTSEFFYSLVLPGVRKCALTDTLLMVI